MFFTVGTHELPLPPDEPQTPVVNDEERLHCCLVFYLIGTQLLTFRPDVLDVLSELKLATRLVNLQAVCKGVAILMFRRVANYVMLRVRPAHGARCPTMTPPLNFQFGANQRSGGIYPLSLLNMSKHIDIVTS